MLHLGGNSEIQRAMPVSPAVPSRAPAPDLYEAGRSPDPSRHVAADRWGQLRRVVAVDLTLGFLGRIFGTPTAKNDDTPRATRTEPGRAPRRHVFALTWVGGS